MDSRIVDGGQSTRRRRECTHCGGRFTTVERAVLMVQKRSGNVEEFDRDKVVTGVRRACQGRNVSDAQLKRLAQEVEKEVRRTGKPNVNANDIGLAILGPLKDLDEVAYLRFASVYKKFESAADFQSEIRLMRRRDTRGWDAE